MTTVKVKIENAYSDGHTSERIVELVAPRSDIDGWFNVFVYPETGDGHGLGNDLGSCYTATIIEAADESLVGLRSEWSD